MMWVGLAFVSLLAWPMAACLDWLWHDYKRWEDDQWT
jgi:hypothetical protein